MLFTEHQVLHLQTGDTHISFGMSPRLRYSSMRTAVTCRPSPEQVLRRWAGGHNRVTLQSSRVPLKQRTPRGSWSLNARLSRQHGRTRKECLLQADNEAREVVSRENCSHMGLGNNRKPGGFDGHSEPGERPRSPRCETSLGLLRGQTWDTRPRRCRSRNSPVGKSVPAELGGGRLGGEDCRGGRAVSSQNPPAAFQSRPEAGNAGGSGC